jgi:hypothetical protein
MRATDFEYRHQTLLHLVVVGLAFLTYAFQPDDIVWAFVKHHTIYRTPLERMVFGFGALEILCSAALQTWANAYRLSAANADPLLASHGVYRRLEDLIYIGRLLFALGIGLMAPLSGTVILLTGEVALVVRLFLRNRYRAPLEGRSDPFVQSMRTWLSAAGASANWKDAVRKEASRWGLALTMIVFTLTLRDRLAEILAGASLLFWFALNWSAFLRPSDSRRNA